MWLDESFDHLIRSDAEFDDKVLYIQVNAMETGVSRPELYPRYWREPAQAGACATAKKALERSLAKPPQEHSAKLP